MTRKDIGNLIHDQFGKEVTYLALELNEKYRIVSHWEEKKNQAEYHLKQNQEKINNIRKKISEALKNNDKVFEAGCTNCGLEAENTDLCNWCYVALGGNSFD